jgi:hypothetical protein
VTAAAAAQPSDDEFELERDVEYFVEPDGRSPRGRASLLLAVVFVLLACSPAAPQSATDRSEVFVAAGACRMGGDEGSLGTGPCVLAGAGFHLAPRVSAEVDVMRMRHERDIAGGPLEGTATGAFGNLSYQFTEGRIRIFVIGSAGFLHSETTQTYPVAGRPTTFRSEDEGFAWGGGGGAKIFLTTRLSLRPQVRLVFNESTGVMGLVATSIGAGYHW